jgi:U3 small nucleolar RNA-associated protein 3
LALVHTSRDKILLEDDALGSDDGDEDEVFGLKGLSDSDEGDEAGGVAGGDLDMEDEASEEEPPPAPKSKPKSKRLKKTEEPPSSEEGDSSSEEETWGRTKAAYYASNADRLDSDDEEANQLQEQEAMRLQAKAREEMVEDDFGFGDAARFTVDGGDTM